MTAPSQTTEIATPVPTAGQLVPAVRNAAGVSSPYEFENRALLVEVRVEGGVISLVPTWADRYRYIPEGPAYISQESQAVRLPLGCSPGEMGAGLLTAIARCGGEYQK